MSILSLFDIPELLDSIVGVIGKHISDPGVMAEVKAQMASIAVPESLAQAKIEATDETSPRDYIWAVRSTVEWICIFGLFMAVVVNPILGVLGFPAPQVPITIVLNLLYGLLGLGATHLAETVFGNKL